MTEDILSLVNGIETRFLQIRIVYKVNFEKKFFILKVKQISLKKQLFDLPDHIKNCKINSAL